MPQYAAFLRAVNVAGHSRVTMAALAQAFAQAGCLNVRTYIQSGNVVFDSAGPLPAVETRLRRALAPLLGVEPEMAVRTIRDLRGLVAADPFAGVSGEPGIKVYVVFLAARPRARPGFPLVNEKERLEAIGMRPREVFVLSRRKPTGLYGFPNAFVERAFGVAATTRNWTTVTKVTALAAGGAAGSRGLAPRRRSPSAPAAAARAGPSGSRCRAS